MDASGEGSKSFASKDARGTEPHLPRVKIPLASERTSEHKPRRMSVG